MAPTFYHVTSGGITSVTVVDETATDENVASGLADL